MMQITVARNHRQIDLGKNTFHRLGITALKENKALFEIALTSSLIWALPVGKGILVSLRSLR
jgi:hypothetical protein